MFAIIPAAVLPKRVLHFGHDSRFGRIGPRPNSVLQPEQHQTDSNFGTLGGAGIFTGGGTGGRGNVGGWNTGGLGGGGGNGGRGCAFARGCGASQTTASNGITNARTTTQRRLRDDCDMACVSPSCESRPINDAKEGSLAEHKRL